MVELVGALTPTKRHKAKIPVPNSASKEEQEQAAQKLLQAFSVASTSPIKQRNFAHSSGMGLLLGKLPQAVLMHITNYAYLDSSGTLKCLSPAWLELVQSLGLRCHVNSSMLSLDMQMSMTKLLALLTSCPVRAKIQVLRLPPSAKLGRRGAMALYSICPNLEELNLGYMYPGTSPNTDELLAVAKSFPRLSSVRFNMRNVPEHGVVKLVHQIGGQLRDLRIECGLNSKAYLGDVCLHIIAQHCPRLTSLAIHNDPCNYDEDLDTLTADGVSAVVLNCGLLKNLELGLTMRVGLNLFTLIADRLETGALLLRRLYTFGVLSLLSSDGMAVEQRLRANLDVLTTSDDEYRKLVMSQRTGTYYSLFLPTFE